MKNLKVIIAAIAIASLAFGFISVQTHSPSQDKPVDEKRMIVKELVRKGILVNDVLISAGREIVKAFNTTVEIPEDSKIAFVMFMAPPNKQEGDAYLEEHAKVIYTVLDADPTIDGVLVWETSYARFSNTALILYADRKKAEEVRNSTQNYEELINNFPLIEYTPQGE
jgi:hypothetical protein